MVRATASPAPVQLRHPYLFIALWTCRMRGSQDARDFHNAVMAKVAWLTGTHEYEVVVKWKGNHVMPRLR